MFENNLASSFYHEMTDLTFNFTAGGGLTLFFVNGSNSHTVISNCTFKDNHAGINDSNRLDAEQRPPLYVPRGHGGGILVSFQTTVGHKVVVRDCKFAGNSAELTGGAISVQFYRGMANTVSMSTDSSSNNTVEIDNTTFEANSAMEGGAVCVKTFEAANYNKVILNGSVLHGNRAIMSGGAFSFNIQVLILVH